MTYKEIVENVRKSFGNADVSSYQDHLAVQVNITGEGGGAFYVEINDGTLNIEEFDYIDNHAEITAAANEIIDIFSGKLDMNKALENGQIEIKGDTAKALSLQPVIDGSKKSATKKTTAKKTTDKKPVAKKEEKITSKTTATKAAAKKTASKKSGK